MTTSRFADGGVDGELRTGYLGVDRRISDDLVAGIALTRSLGDIDSRADGAAGHAAAADTTLTGVLPYGRLELDRGEVWGLLGAGWGEVDLSDEHGAATADLSLRLAGAGWRRETGLSGPGGMRLAVKADAVSTWLSADAAGAELPDVDADARRLRLLLEGNRRSVAFGRRGHEPAAGRGRPLGRRRGFESGGGVELNLSLSHRRPETGLELLVDGRYTLLHGVDQFEDRSLSVAVSWDRGRARRRSAA